MSLVKESYLKHQNTLCLTVATITTINLFCYYVCQASLAYSLPFIVAFFLVDLPFATNDIKLHHAFGLLMTASKVCMSISKEDGYPMLASMYSTEISTIFYVLQLFMKDKMTTSWTVVKCVNGVAFVVAFFKFRICDYYTDLIVNPAVHDAMRPYVAGKWTNYAFIYTGIYGLYGLNLYWFVIICKMALKPIVRKWSVVQLRIAEQWITSFTQYINLALLWWAYSGRQKESYYMDMFGCLMLAIGSNGLHYRQYIMYKASDKPIIPLKPISHFYIDDQLAIHARSLLCLTSSTFYGSKIPLIISGITHLGSSVFMAKTIMDSDDVVFDDTDENTKTQYKTFLWTIYTTAIVPLGFDLVFIAYNAHDEIARINLIVACYLVFIVLRIAPLYEFNHVAFHLALILQGYFAAKCNLR